MGDIALHWREPLWFLLALIPWVIWFIRYWRSITDSRDYADAELLPWARVEQQGLHRWRHHWRELLSVLAWLLLAAALAGPRLPQSLHTSNSTQLPELMVVLDVSHSMSANDIYPTRLERARLELHDLINRLEGWRMGMVIYAAQPHLLVPPSQDKSLLRYYLQIPRTSLLPVEGSDLTAALQFAAIVNTRNKPVPRHLLLITDGETLEPNDAVSPALQKTVTTLHQNGHRLYVLGVGSQSGSTLTDPEGGWLQVEGQSVISRLHTGRLEKLATLGQGRYATAQDDHDDWQQLYDNGLVRTLSGTLMEKTGGQVIWRELFAWCLWPGLLLLLLAHGQRPQQHQATTGLSLLSVILLNGILLALPQDSMAAQDDTLREAWQAFEQENYPQAEQSYRRVEGYRGRMGEASSAYRRGAYRVALQQFTRAVMLASNDTQRADALFNLGNCYARLQRYQKAQAIYTDVLRYQPTHAPAKQNLALAKKRARELASGNGSDKGRQGRGTRTRKLGEQERLSGGNLTLGETTQPWRLESGNSGQPDQPGPSSTPRASLSDDSVTKMEDRQWSYAIDNLQQLEAAGLTAQSDPQQFWQRLFETEAGYPAPLKQPHHKQGVRPW